MPLLYFVADFNVPRSDLEEISIDVELKFLRRNRLRSANCLEGRFESTGSNGNEVAVRDSHLRTSGSRQRSIVTVSTTDQDKCHEAVNGVFISLFHN